MLATDGNRNTQLNKSAYALGQLIGAGALDRSSVETMLLNSARAVGLGERESLATIQSGLAAGIQSPRHVKRPNRKNENANADASGASNPPKSPRLSQATRLVEIGIEASLFHTPDGEAYAVMQMCDHRETWSLRSKGFRRWFARRFFEIEHKAPSSQALQDALSVLEGHALYEGAERTVHTRVGEHDGKVYLDLVNGRWQVVEISNQGWRVTDTTPIYFRRTRGMLALPYPVAGCIDEVRPFLNLASDDDWRLLASWLVGGLRERGPYPVLVIHGGQGSAKSTMQRIVRWLIDPNAAPLRSEPREERDLIIAAVNGWVIALDNLSNLPPWLSDGICRLATGGGFATRELYSDSEEVLFDAQRPVILNGIEELAVRGDLLDRSIVLYLPEMSDTKRRDEKSLWEGFHIVHPRVLGGMLNAVSAGLRNLPTTKVSPLPRMAPARLTNQQGCNIIQAVNNIHSIAETEYLPRWITPRLQNAVREHPVVVLTGARQVGKSTLLRRAAPFSDWRYYTFDDYDVLRQAEAEPQSLWAGTSQIVLDEVQKFPALLPAIKRAVDASRGVLHFALSGSANLLLMQKVSESLAGRAVYFALQPMTIGEVNQRPIPSILEDMLAGKLPVEGRVSQVVEEVVPLMLRGLMPALLHVSGPAAWLEWWEGYVATYLERDLRQISQIDSLPDFHRVMELLALRTGQLLNQSETARDAKLSQPTIHRYLNLLEATYLLQRLPAFTASRTTRLLKSPKVQWADPGLAIYLAGYFDAASLATARELGGFFETFVLHHIKVLADLLTPRGRLFFWRTLAGKEADVIVEQGQRLIAFEIKMSDTVNFADADGLRLFLKEHSKAVSGAVIYRGQEIRRLDERIVALPLSIILGL